MVDLSPERGGEGRGGRSLPTFTIHPLEGERVLLAQLAHVPHLLAELIEGGGGIYTGDEDVPGARKSTWVCHHGHI